jgi:hypothetical protein
MTIAIDSIIDKFLFTLMSATNKDISSHFLERLRLKLGITKAELYKALGWSRQRYHFATTNGTGASYVGRVLEQSESIAKALDLSESKVREAVKSII